MDFRYTKLFSFNFRFFLCLNCLSNEAILFRTTYFLFFLSLWKYTRIGWNHAQNRQFFQSEIINHCVTFQSIVIWHHKNHCLISIESSFQTFFACIELLANASGVSNTLRIWCIQKVKNCLKNHVQPKSKCKQKQEFQIQMQFFQRHNVSAKMQSK